ncbi:MAG: germination protein YpeB, partial [Clostridiales bacterium]|nr:germination protein YpeB [Clostridiales bacterium]
HKREQKTERKRNRAGFGGWLAAVISLGAACLILATIVTAGAMRMSDMDAESANGYHATLFEMVSVSEDMDDNLSKLRISSGSNEQRKLLTQILVDAALMESAIERIPLDAATGTDISSFVNKTGSYARTLLAKLAAGKTLTETEKNTISYLYEVNSGLYNELNKLATTMTEKEFREFLNGKEGSVSQGFGEAGQGTHAEPKDTVDAPFAGEGNVGQNSLEGLEEITSSRAEEIVKNMFNGYHVQNVEFTGETVTQDMQCYNFVLTDENDVEIYAQITKKGGKLAFFDTYEVCTDKNFDLATCNTLAQEFLAELGMENMEAVWLSDTGMTADITYVSKSGDARVYSDMVRVRVCESKGRVVGIDAKGYLLNHTDRKLNAVLSEEDARSHLNGQITPNEVHLALVPVDGEEVLCYEYSCTYGEDEYVVYLDANTGDEVQVYRVRESARGSYLR